MVNVKAGFSALSQAVYEPLGNAQPMGNGGLTTATGVSSMQNAQQRDLDAGYTTIAEAGGLTTATGVSSVQNEQRHADAGNTTFAEAAPNNSVSPISQDLEDFKPRDTSISASGMDEEVTAMPKPESTLAPGQQQRRTSTQTHHARWDGEILINVSSL